MIPEPSTHHPAPVAPPQPRGPGLAIAVALCLLAGVGLGLLYPGGCPVKPALEATLGPGTDGQLLHDSGERP